MPGSLRSAGATLLLLGSLLAPARPALADDGYIVDNSDRTVSVTGVWQTTGTTPGFYGSDYAFRVAGNGSSSAAHEHTVRTEP